jgi:hypothetical protein
MSFFRDLSCFLFSLNSGDCRSRRMRWGMHACLPNWSYSMGRRCCRSGLVIAFPSSSDRKDSMIYNIRISNFLHCSRRVFRLPPLRVR